MTTSQRTTAVGVFTDRGQAERAIEVLHEAGFADDQLGFVAPHGHVNAEDIEGTDTSSVPGAAAGAVGGGVIGGVIGAAVSLLIPGLGLAVAGGILAATLGGAAVGAVAGGFAGSLASFGVPEEEARYYQEQLAAGRSIVTVTSTDRYDEAARILRDEGASDAAIRADMPELEAGGPGLYNADRYPTGVPPVMLPGMTNLPGGTMAFPAPGNATTYPTVGNAPGLWPTITAEDELARREPIDDNTVVVKRPDLSSVDEQNQRTPVRQTSLSEDQPRDNDAYTADSPRTVADVPTNTINSTERTGAASDYPASDSTSTFNDTPAPDVHPVTHDPNNLPSDAYPEAPEPPIKRPDPSPAPIQQQENEQRRAYSSNNRQ